MIVVGAAVYWITGIASVTTLGLVGQPRERQEPLLALGNHDRLPTQSPDRVNLFASEPEKLHPGHGNALCMSL